MMGRFDVWAPRADRMQVRIDGTDHDLAAAADGWWCVEVSAAETGTDYAFLIGADDTPIPDPRSLRQPDGVHGPSRLYDHAAYTWSDESWTGRPLAGGIIYELHIGTFTPEGSFEAAAGRLDHLVELGIDFVEVLPVNAVNGTHNWGYDGVGWYAVHEPYGGPDGFKRFIDACHHRGIGVILDVVYNHLGPSGNYLDRFGPYLTDAGANTWGRFVNLDQPGSDSVRRHIVDNALMWLRDYHVDGLRIDAVHAFSDHRAVHLLEQFATEIDALAEHVRRPLFLIAESDLNDPRLISSRESGGYGLAGQWSDDFHHALHALLTGERQGYYADFGSLECFSKVLLRAFFHDGTWSSFRRRSHGRPVDTLRTGGWKFVVCLQNHDQIGNRATGDRIGATISTGLLKIGAALTLTSPFTPMLFMGEEWAASTPWQFFTSHPEPELAASVAEGRRAEFADHGWTGDVPDPQDPRTFSRSKLNWDELQDDPHAEILDFYRRLIALRHDCLELTDSALAAVDVRFDEDRRWLVVTRGGLAVVANLATERQVVPLTGNAVELLLASTQGFVYTGAQVELDGESVAVLRTATGA